MSFSEGSERRSTKQESVWLFRIWYNFDHKYPAEERTLEKFKNVQMFALLADTSS